MKLHAIIPQHQKQRFPGVGVLLHRLDPRPDRVDGSLFFFSTRWHCTSRALPTYKPRLEIASSTQWANNKVGFLFCFFVFFYNPWSTEKGSVEKERIGKESEKKKRKKSDWYFAQTWVPMLGRGREETRAGTRRYLNERRRFEKKAQKRETRTRATGDMDASRWRWRW